MRSLKLSLALVFSLIVVAATAFEGNRRGPVSRSRVEQRIRRPGSGLLDVLDSSGECLLQGGATESSNLQFDGGSCALSE